MKRSEIKTGETYAVVEGSMYQGAEALAVPAVVLEVGVEVANRNHSGRYGWLERNPSSVSKDGLRVQILNPKTMEPTGREAVVKTRNVVATWADHRETLRLRAERKAEADRRATDAKEELEAWTARLGLNSYDLPGLGGGFGASWDSEYNRNRAALVRVLRAAYELGRKDGSA